MDAGDPKTLSICTSLAFVYFLEEKVNLFDNKELYENRVKKFEQLREQWEKMSAEEKKVYADKVDFDKRAEEDQFISRIRKIEESQPTQKSGKQKNRRKTEGGQQKIKEEQIQKTQDDNQVAPEEGKVDIKQDVDEENKQNESRIIEEVVRNINESHIHEEIIQGALEEENQGAKEDQIEEFKNEMNQVEQPKKQSKKGTKQQKRVSIAEDQQREEVREEKLQQHRPSKRGASALTQRPFRNWSKKSMKDWFMNC